MIKYILSKVRQYYLSKIFFAVFILFATIDIIEAVLGFNRVGNLLRFAVDMFILFIHPMRTTFVEGIKVDLKHLKEYITQ